MKKLAQLDVTSELVEMFEQVPMSRSAAIVQALLNAEREPELLVKAFRQRLVTSRQENSVRIAYSRDQKLDKTVEKLCEMTRLPETQVVRLCMEPYIHRL